MRVLGLALALSLVACESVPDLQFIAEDAGADAAPVADASPEPTKTCPSPGPSGGRCCGQSWCLGECDDQNCELCASRCGSELCCGKGGNALCKAKCP
jgi:hypothetical protein